MTSIGVILAGGQSRRMNGREKSLLHLGGNPLIDLVAARLSAQVSSLVINANSDASQFQHLELPVIADSIDGFAGPLAGVLAGMEWAKANTDASHVLTVAADTPFFPGNYTDRMLAASSEDGGAIVIARTNGQKHPVFGLWPIHLVESLKTFLVDEELNKIMLFVQRHPHMFVDFEADRHDPFFNVNTPEQLAEAEVLLGAP